MTFCLTFPFSRTELTMRTYSWTVPLAEGTLTDRTNRGNDHHTTVSIVDTKSLKEVFFYRAFQLICVKLLSLRISPKPGFSR